MNQSEMVVNVSSISAFMQCRYRWLCTWHLNREPHRTSNALGFGILLHRVFEDHLGHGLLMQDAVEKQRELWWSEMLRIENEGERKMALESLEMLDYYTELLHEWTDYYPIERTFEVEEPFLLPHPNDPSLLLRGRPDRMAVIWGKLFHVQNRALDKSTSFPIYTTLAKRHMHEHVYAWAMKKKYPSTQYGGTLMNLLRKLTYRRKPTKKFPAGEIAHKRSEIFYQGMVTIRESDTSKMMGHVQYWCDEMRRVLRNYEDGEWPAPNEKMNGGFSGRTIDPYFRVLQGEIKLDDDRYFRPREDTYGGRAPLEPPPAPAGKRS